MFSIQVEPNHLGEDESAINATTTTVPLQKLAAMR